MNLQEPHAVLITDVTLREFGQNVPAASLDLFTPAMRADVARRLAVAGFRRMEVFSCVSPKAAPAMNERDIRAVADALGRLEAATVVTLVPNLAGYKRFLSMGLGPGGYGHEMGVFFSAVEAHNLANLGRTIRDTLVEYETILEDASARGIPVAAYISAALGYRPPGGDRTLRPAPAEINAHIDRFLELGAAAVTLSDLQGVADERETASFFEELLDARNGRDISLLGYHPHHLSGERAVANSLAAHGAGIRRFDASLGGTGGCITGAPGNQPTEGLIRAFHARGIETGIDERLAADLARDMQHRLYECIPPLSRTG